MRRHLTRLLERAAVLEVGGDPRAAEGAVAHFGGETGDAWLLDWDDGLTAPLARDGDPERIHIEETDANFTIEWKGSYRIEGAAFIYTDRKRGGMRAILGYPTQKLEAAVRSS